MTTNTGGPAPGERGAEGKGTGRHQATADPSQNTGLLGGQARRAVKRAGLHIAGSPLAPHFAPFPPERYRTFHGEASRWQPVSRAELEEWLARFNGWVSTCRALGATWDERVAAPRWPEAEPRRSAIRSVLTFVSRATGVRFAVAIADFRPPIIGAFGTFVEDAADLRRLEWAARLEPATPPSDDEALFRRSEVLILRRTAEAIVRAAMDTSGSGEP